MNLLHKSATLTAVLTLATLATLAKPSMGKRTLSPIPLGSVTYSVLTPEQMTNQSGGTWVLMDGRNIEGSDLNRTTGMIEIPDGRGLYLRGKNHGRNDGRQNPDGELDVGAYQADMIASHSHGYDRAHGGGEADNSDGGNPYGGNSAASTAATGGNETRPKSITLNPYIKINEIQE